MSNKRSEPTQCRECGADIEWVTTEEEGRRIPIDVFPTEAGEFAKSSMDASGGEKIYRFVPGPSRGNYPGKLHETHFLSCPFKDRQALR